MFCLVCCQVTHEVVLACVKLVLAGLLLSFTQVMLACSAWFVAKLHMRWYWHVLN